jgi:hypothetical protein
MCNPRRVEVTATRQVAEAWDLEVRRAAAQSATVTGEARILQPLDASVGAPALAALERALERGFPGWARVPGGFRREVQGGYVLYSPDDQSLAIAATRSDLVHGHGEAEARLTGSVTGEVGARGEGRYYDDGHAGLTEERARREALGAAEARIEAEVQARIEGARREAEQAVAEALRGDADRAAQADLRARADARRAALGREAEGHLAAVGVQARRAFHELLSVAYRDALLALARSRGARDIQCTEQGDCIEIDFLLPD